MLKNNDLIIFLIKLVIGCVITKLYSRIQTDIVLILNALDLLEQKNNRCIYLQVELNRLDGGSLAFYPITT
jgi:hypothetical protein